MACLLLFGWFLPSAFAAATKEEDYKTVDGQGSWDYRYDVSKLPTGKYNLIIQGTDPAGNSSVAGPFNVYVDPSSDLPVASISTPAPGQRVGGDLTVVGTCVDDDGVERVEVSLDKGDYAAAEGKEYWSWSLPLGSLVDGPHTLSARGVDVNGVTGTAVSVKFNLDTRAPIVRMTSHQNGALVGGMLSLAGTVEDANGVKGLAWSADRSTFLPLRLQVEKGGSRAHFTLGVDTRRLKDGPHVYWFRAGDLTGSIGVMAFLFFVDNTAPALQILSPGPDRRVSGVVTVVGKISELVGVKSLSWNAGDAGSGTIALVPGNPYWIQDIDLGKVKGSSARVSFTATDNAGNSATKQLSLSLLPDEADLPVVLVRSPSASGRSGSVVPLVGAVRDDDGVKAVAWSLDGKPPVTLESGEAFSSSLTGVVPGKHRLAVHGIDINGRAGRDVVIDFLGTGDAPTASLDTVIIGARTVPFRPGQEIARDEEAVLHGRIGSLAHVQAATVSFGGGAEEKPVLKPGGVGETLFDVKIPPTVPFGLVAVTLKVTDEYGQTAELRTIIHVRNDALRNAEPGIQFFDGRIGADGSVALGAGGPLAGIMAAEEIGSAALEPQTDVVTVSAVGDRILVSPARAGISVPVRVKVVSKKGHVFTSDAYRYVTDATRPVIHLSSPRSGDWISGKIAVAGTATDEGGIESLEVSLDGGKTWSSVPFSVGTTSYSFQLSPALEGVADGAVDVVVRCTDIAGNVSVDHALALKDSTAPSIIFLSPRPEEEIGGAFLLSGVVSDAGALARVELSTDGKTFSPLAVKGAFATVIDPGSLNPVPDRITVRAVDRGGNETVASLPLRISAAAGGQGTQAGQATQAPAGGAKDTVKPLIEILSPVSDARMYGRVFFIGRATDNAAVRKVTFDAGADGKGEVSLLPASPWFVQEIELKDQKAAKLVVTFTAEDSSANKADAKVTVSVDPGAGLPAVNVLRPAAKARVDGSLLLSGTVAARDQVRSILLSVDGAAESELPPADAFAAVLDSLSPGPHRLILRAVDASGLSSPAVPLELTMSGPPPVVALASVVSGKDTAGYTPGMRAVLGPSASLTGTVTLSGAVKSAEYSLSSGPARPLTVGKPDKAGVSAFNLPLPADLPHGRIDLRISVTDDLNRRSDFLGFFYKTEKDPGNTSDDEGVSFVDARIGQGGVVRLAPGESLAGYYNGRPVAAAVIEPETPFLKASFEGNFLSVTALGEGTKDGVRVRVTTADGDTFRSEPLSFRGDSAPPELAVTAPVTGAWAGARVTLKGAATDSNGLASLEYSIGSSGSFVPLALPGAGGPGTSGPGAGSPSAGAPGASGTGAGSPSAGAPGVFESVLDLSASPDGDVPIVVRAQDIAGRSTELTLVVMKDTKEPQVAMLTPPADDPVNGIITLAGSASDQGIIEKVELSTDGKTWSAVAGTSVFSAQIDLSRVKPEQVSLRVTDRSGNTTVIAPPMNVQQAADVPDLQVQVPQEGDVQRNDFVVSGTVLDDDGVGAILYRIDGGDWVRLPGANTFSIPVALADITDNEHTIELKAEDLNGVTSEPRTRAVRISKAEPVSKLVTPLLSSTARGVVTMGGESSDRNGIGEVSLSFDNGQTFRAADGKETWGYRLDTRVLKDGTYSVIVRAVDSYGTVGLASTLLNIDNTPPDIVLDTPSDGADVSGTLTLAGSARDDIAVASLRARIRPLGSTSEPRVIELPSGGPFSRAVDLAGLAPGWYDLSVEGVDKAANSAVVSRNVLIEPGTVGERLDVWFPGNGEDLHGHLTVSGRLTSSRTPAAIALLVDGNEAGTTSAKDGGFFSTAAPESLSDGAHSIMVEARFTDGSAVRSEERRVTWHASGPWVRIVSHSLGDWVRERPFISGEAGRIADLADQQAAGQQDAGQRGADQQNAGQQTASQRSADTAAIRRAAEERKLVRIEVSLDNGRTFAPAQGTAQWKYRLETQGIPDGPVRLMVKAVFADGASAVDQTILRLDDTPPQVQLLSPREEGRFNGEIALAGTAADENGVAQVRAAVRKGDKASYEVPGFIQGLYFDGHLLGATEWDFGAGLTFFDQNVKLQAQVGVAPEGRFSGLMVGAKLLANIVRLPFSYFLGPDLDFLSLSFAVGANFSYVTNSGSTIQFTDQGLILGAVVGQLEFPIVRIKSWPVFNTWSLYTEYQLWFISSDVSAGFVNRLAFGMRVGLF